MKKIMIVTLHFAILLALLVIVGIQPDADEQAVEKFTGEIERNVKIKVLENDTAISQGYFPELIRAFNEAYAEYGVEAVDANMGENTNLIDGGPYGYGPDVLYQANDLLMRYVDGKHILPLPVEALDAYETTETKAWEAFQRKISSRVYTFAVPVNVQGPLLYYRKDLIPVDWKENWDDNNNNIPDMIETWNHMHAFSKVRRSENKWGYMRSFLEPYFSSGYLFSYGAYVFGNNDTDATDVGFNKGNAYLGASVLRQQATLMDQRAIDDAITVTAYAQLAQGNFFATVTTPDVYNLFVNQFKTYHVSLDNLGVAQFPMLPVSGDLDEKITDWDTQLMSSIQMGGVNGYAVSSYTKYPNASLAFIDFATKYEMILRRNELLGIVPARKDVSDAVGGLSKVINENLAEGRIYVMPSILATNQIWTPLQSFFQDIARDVFREGKEIKYTSHERFQSELDRVNQQIYDAIHTLA